MPHGRLADDLDRIVAVPPARKRPDHQDQEPECACLVHVALLPYLAGLSGSHHKAAAAAAIRKAATPMTDRPR